MNDEFTGIWKEMVAV